MAVDRRRAAERSSGLRGEPPDGGGGDAFDLGGDVYEQLWQLGATAPREALFAAALTGADELVLEPAELPGQRRAGSGESLTRREHEVARLAADGLSNREIAERLFISRRTVDAHMERILSKLGINSRNRIAVKLATATTGE